MFLVQIWPQGFSCLQPELLCQILYLRDEGSSGCVGEWELVVCWLSACQHTERWGEVVKQE